MKYIEKDFPIEGLNEIAKKESVVSLKKPVYLIHRWWARRLGSVFRMIILTSFLDWEELEREARRSLGIGERDIVEENLEKLVREKMEEILWEKFYSKNEFNGEVVLDPFMGGGTTVVEALRHGLRPIGIDINPVAWFVTKKEVEPLELDAFEREFNKLELGVGKRIKSYYKTRCPLCRKETKNRKYEWTGGTNGIADVMYVFWVNKVRCLNPDCKKEVHLFPSFKIASKRSKKGIIHTVFCPKCKYIIKVNYDDAETRCPECGFRFVPNEGHVFRGKYKCLHCGQRYDILDSVRKEKKIPAREMYAIEYYCSVHGRGYKRIDEYDIELFEKAKKELEDKWVDLIGKYIPDQEIPDGYNTKQAKNYNYRYFYEMFNERQLLCISSLLKEIMSISDQNIKEYFIAILSNILEYNNMFCRYKQTMRYLENLFSLHAYLPKHDPLENNLWGARTRLGQGTFDGHFRKSIRSKKYCYEPYEYKISLTEGKAVDKIPTKDIITTDRTNEDALLICQTSEDLSFIKQKVDAIITDPPYYGNVMYSELADFFYVWLRLALKDRYPWFRGKYSRNKREIIKNEIQNKDEKFFLKGIERVFSECYKVLKDEGLMVFTFHHKETEAWASILQPVLCAGFYINAVYPIHSEMMESYHISNKKSISYDTIIVCRKRLVEPHEISWNNLKIQIYAETKEMINRLLKTRPYLGEGNVKVIAMGKGLELYSRHYPKVLFKEGYLEPKKATFLMDELVDQIIEEVKESELPTGLDEVSRIYMGYLTETKYIDYDSLNKLLRSKNFDIRALENEEVIEKRRKNEYIVLGPAKRHRLIQDKIDRSKDLLYIDKMHYLIYLYRRGRPVALYLSKWKDETLSMILKLYYEKTKDEDVRKIIEMLEKTTEAKKAPTLEEFILEKK